MPRFTYDAAFAAALFAARTSPVMCIDNAFDTYSMIQRHDATCSTGATCSTPEGHSAMIQRQQVLSKVPLENAVIGMDDAFDTPAVKVTDKQFTNGDFFKSGSSLSFFAVAARKIAVFALVVCVLRRFFPSQAADGFDDDLKLKQAVVPAETEVPQPARPVVVFDKIDDVLELAQAVRSGDAGRCDVLLRKTRSLADRGDHCGCSALHVAADCGSVSLARLMLDSGASVNAREAWEETPLHLAARAGSAGVCELLLARRAELDAPNSNDASPLLVAAQAGKEDVCDFLLTRGAGVGPCLKDEDLPPILSALLVRRVFEASVTPSGHGGQSPSPCNADPAERGSALQFLDGRRVLAVSLSHEGAKRLP